MGKSDNKSSISTRHLIDQRRPRPSATIDRTTPTLVRGRDYEDPRASTSWGIPSTAGLVNVVERRGWEESIDRWVMMDVFTLGMNRERSLPVLMPLER